MKHSIHRSLLLLGLAGLLGNAPAFAQSDRSSLLPYTSSGYVGVNVGKPDYRLGCGAGAFSCDDPNASLHIYTGGRVNEWFGAEVGYLNMGKADRQGGTTRAHGLNLSLVGRVPVGQFDLFAKLGTTYSRTRISTDPLSTEPNGTASGWGTSYGIGAGYDFTPNWGVVLQFDRHNMKFAGHGRESVDATSIGVRFRY